MGGGVGGMGDRVEGGWGACCRCAHRRRASPLTCLAMCFLVLTYNLLGGFLFLALEGGDAGEGGASGEGAVAASTRPAADLRASTVERLWAITEDLNILYKENWTKLAAKELMDFQKVLVKSMSRESRASDHNHYRWTFSTSFLYALTLITTIGHGNMTPRSSAGKLVAVAYACVGIPIIMVYLSTLGAALARPLRALYSRLVPAPWRPPRRHAGVDCLSGPHYADPRDCKLSDCDKRDEPEGSRTPFQAALNLDSLRGGYHWTCRDHTRVPIALSLLLIVAYVALGTVVFHTTEKWTLIDGCYFSFASLATIGFGSLRPGLHASLVSARAEDAAVGVCCVYILVGVVVVAASFELAQDAAGAAARGLAALGARAVHPPPPARPPHPPHTPRHPTPAHPAHAAHPAPRS